MSGSLKEELLKLGLGRNLKPAEPERRKRTAPRPKAERPRPAPVVPAPKPAPRAADPREVDRERARRQMRVAEQLEAHKLDDAQAETATTTRPATDRYTYVTEAQQRRCRRDRHRRRARQDGSCRAHPAEPARDRPELRVIDPPRARRRDADPEHQVLTT
jgi:hypothetical protein